MAGLFDALLSAYVAPQMRAQQSAQAEAEAPNRTASAWDSIIGNMPTNKPSTPSASSLYTAQPSSTGEAAGTGDVLNALTQSPEAKQAHEVQSKGKELSPLEMMNYKLNAMMKSGDPTLQKQAMSMMPEYFKERLGQNQTADQKNYSAASKDPGYQKWLENKSIQKTMAMQDPNAPLPKDVATNLVGANGEPLNPPINATWKWAQDNDARYSGRSSFTEANQKAAMFADAMQGAEDDIQSLMTSGYDPTTVQQQLGNIPYVGSHIATGEQQLMNRAQDGWVRAKLRDESGATIGDEEMRKEKEIYFPQPGNTPLVIEAKRRARELALKGMTGKAGGKFKPYTKEERQTMRDIVSKEIEKAKAQDTESAKSARPDGLPEYGIDLNGNMVKIDW
jgi:hypothetical protein